jgi:broad specificity phosphatase PhoE
MKIIYLIRHGQTKSNFEKRFQGHTDIELNELGLNQAKKLALHSQNFKIDKIYSSDLLRAYNTANEIAKVKKIAIIKNKNLREGFFGAWEGKKVDDILSVEPKNYDAIFNNPENAIIKNGESFPELQQRAWNEFQKIVAQEKDNSNIVIVSHGATIRTIICSILGTRLNNMWKFIIDNASISCFYELDGEFYVKYLNDTSFLK